MLINAAKTYSILGNPNSLVPLAVKDGFSSIGMTAESFATGKEEGVDRSIDEFGTEFVWLGGVPAYRWLFDKTAFKISGLDAKYDARNLKDKEIFSRTLKYAPTDGIKKAIEKIDRNQGVFKKLAAAKFLVSTSLAITSYITLTKLKQRYTEKQIKKRLITENIQSKNNLQNNNINAETNNEKNNPAFKSLGSVAENLAYNSVKNMWIVDGAITSERLLDSRNLQEFIGYTIKEGFSLCFLYYAGGKIQELLEKNAAQKHNCNIALDAKVLEHDYIKQIFSDGSIKHSLKEFDKIKPLDKNTSKVKKDAVALYDFIYKNPENAIVKMAKQSNVITMYKKTNKIDSRAYIDFEKIEMIKNSVEKLYKQYQEAISSGKNPEYFFKKARKLKRRSIITNIGASIFALGILAPGIMLFKRQFLDKDTEFQTKKDIRNKLIKDGIINNSYNLDTSK